MLLSSPVSKEYVQSELVSQLEELKEVCIDDPRQRSNLLKTVELLGRSIGAFSDKIQVEEVSPNQALDKLIEMSKNSIVSIKTLPKGSGTDYE